VLLKFESAVLLLDFAWTLVRFSSLSAFWSSPISAPIRWRCSYLSLLLETSCLRLLLFHWDWKVRKFSVWVCVCVFLKSIVFSCEGSLVDAF
jgi:hypothetical protein